MADLSLTKETKHVKQRVLHTQKEPKPIKKRCTPHSKIKTNLLKNGVLHTPKETKPIKQRCISQFKRNQIYQKTADSTFQKKPNLFKNGALQTPNPQTVASSLDEV